MERITDIKIIKACILGHAAGDALGVPVEFSTRLELDTNPVTDMRGYGSHRKPAGTWSDDTSMELCALQALAQPDFSWNKVMDNFVMWYHGGEFTADGSCFDIGGTCAEAISGYVRSGRTDTWGPDDERSNGNGAVMRIIPFILYAPDDIEFTERASALTHGHLRSVTGCGIYSFILREIISNRSKAAVYEGLRKAKAHYSESPEWHTYEPLMTIEKRSRDEIKSGGYVVDTIEAAVWCLLTTDSYSECVLKAVNLGRDTDTVGAVAGGLAGALYGLDGIPEKWLNTLKKRDYIERMCEDAAEAWNIQ